jgi:hypothetical protein
VSSSELISWFPRWAEPPQLRELSFGGRWRCQRPEDSHWGRIAHELQTAGRALRDVPIAEIVSSIDRVADNWSRHDFALRLAARKTIAAATGMSPQAIDESLDLELRNYRSASLLRALRRELGDPAVLDGFVRDGELAGSVRAFGPRLTLVVCTGNVPGLPALPLVRALLAKSAVILKVASGEPSFARRFVESLDEVDPRLSRAIAVTYWAREEEATLRAVLEHTDTVIAYGSDEACAQIRSALAPHQRFVEHAHKLSVGILSRSYIEQHGVKAVAASVARDASVFNQHACIAPQAYFVQGDADERKAFGAALADALARYAERCPLGTQEPQDAASIALERAAHGWRCASDSALELWCDPAGLEWTLTLDSAFEGARSLGDRYLRLVGIDDLGQPLAILRPYARHLQNVGLGVDAQQLPGLAAELAELGASRLSAPGRMSEPSMMWRHDGRMCIAELLRFCDIEMHESTEREGLHE